LGFRIALPKEEALVQTRSASRERNFLGGLAGVKFILIRLFFLERRKKEKRILLYWEASHQLASLMGLEEMSYMSWRDFLCL
jgi:hypothetical protein